MGNPKDENSGNSESYLRKGFNYTKRLVKTPKKDENDNKDLSEKESKLKSVWNSSSSAVKSSYNWMSSKKSEKDVDNNNNIIKENSESYLKRAASYSAETSVGIFDWAFGSRKNTDDENSESRAKSLAISTISGINSSLGFTKSVVTGTYGYIFSNNNENKEISEKNEASTTTYIKDLTTSGLSSSWGFMKSVVKGGYGLISSSTEKPESKPIESASVESNGVTTIVKNVAVSGLSSTWDAMKYVGNGTYGLMFSSNDEKPEQSNLGENKNAVDKIEDISTGLILSPSDGKQVIPDKNVSEKPESKPVEPANEPNRVTEALKKLGYWGLSSSWDAIKYVGKETYGLIII